MEPHQLINRIQSARLFEDPTEFPCGGVSPPTAQVSVPHLHPQRVQPLRCVSARFLFFQDSLPPQPGGMHCVNLYFEVRAEGDLRLNRESSECAWVTPSDVSSYQIVFGNDEALEKYWNRTLV